MAEAPEKNLALDIVRITEAAALASARWLGRGDKEAGDGAAVDAMRVSFATLSIDGLVIIGEGEKDNAPMLFNGEKVGKGCGPSLDVAVDPVEGTNLLAYGRPNAISVVGVAPSGSMFNPGPSYYMQKLVVAREARLVVEANAAGPAQLVLRYRCLLPRQGMRVTLEGGTPIQVEIEGAGLRQSGEIVLDDEVLPIEAGTP